MLLLRGDYVVYCCSVIKGNCVLYVYAVKGMVLKRIHGCVM